MGSWALTVVGHGIHDNKMDGDADVLAKKLIEDLRRAGHTIEHAAFTSGNGRVLSEIAPPGQTARQF